MPNFNDSNLLYHYNTGGGARGVDPMFGMVNLGAPGVFGPASGTMGGFGNPFAPGNDPHGAFGSNLPQIPIPDPHADLAARVPGLDAATAQAFANISASQKGQLSPEVLRMLQDTAAQRATSSGMPGTNMTPGILQGNASLRDLGLDVRAEQQRGLDNFLKATTNVKQTQTLDPALQFEFALQNEVNKHAPNPTEAAAYSKQLFDQYLANMRGPGGGTGNLGGLPSSRGSGGSLWGSPIQPYKPSAPSWAGAAFNTPTLTGGSTATTSQIPGFTPPENWDLFSPDQQWGYGNQLDWARRNYSSDYE